MNTNLASIPEEPLIDQHSNGFRVSFLARVHEECHTVLVGGLYTCALHDHNFHCSTLFLKAGPQEWCSTVFVDLAAPFASVFVLLSLIAVNGITLMAEPYL